MSEDCIICGGSGGLYLLCGPYKSGPYCPDHRWRLKLYLDNKRIENFNKYVNKYQAEEYAKQRHPHCPVVECRMTLEKRDRKDEMDSNHWYYCETHRWVYGDDVVWLTDTELENEEIEAME